MSDSDKLSFYFVANVVVSGGVGTPVVFWDATDPPPLGFTAGLSATLKTVSTKAPSPGTASYDWIILDCDGFAVAGNPQTATGNSVFTMSGKDTVYPLGTVNILNPTQDGTYPFKIHCEQSH